MDDNATTMTTTYAVALAGPIWPNNAGKALGEFSNTMLPTVALEVFEFEVRDRHGEFIWKRY